MILAITTISLAMVGAATVTSLTAVQNAFAAKSCSFGGGKSCWCYSDFNTNVFCYGNKGDCSKAQQSDRSSVSGCFRKNE